MTLGDLLEELRENILHDRSDQIAGASDYLWSDKTLVRYINEAERRMAREALLIRDATTPEVCRLQLKTLEREYQLHESVIALISARVHGDRADLARAGHAGFDTYKVPDTYFFDPSSLSTLPPGKVVAYDTDEGLRQDDENSTSVMTFRAYPPPDPVHAGVVHLRVIRLPIRKLHVDRPDQTPEIPEIHHLDMLDWAAYLALRIVDIDQGAPDRAKEFRTSFEGHVKEARDIAMRKLFTPLQWGFGRSGFSWESN